MEAKTVPNVDIEAILKAMQPPTLPRELYEKVSELKVFISGLDKLHALSVLGGLQCLPNLQANTIRLDWATRLVAADAVGSRRLKRREWQAFLNGDLHEAGINLLEDPIEDFFSAPLITSRGEYSVILSCWENPAFHTEQLIKAFSRLPDGGPRDEVLANVFALLALSKALTNRAGLGRYESGSGEPNSDIKLPCQSRIDALSRMVRFGWGEIEALIGQRQLLLPFMLDLDEAAEITNQPVGNCFIDFRPLIATSDGILIAAPGAITTAIRGLLIHAVTTHSMGRALQKNLNTQFAEIARFGGLGNFVNAPDRAVGEQMVRQGVSEVSAGRFVHVLIAADGFGSWATEGFSRIAAYDQRFSETLFDGMRFAKSEAERRAGFKDGLTVLLLGGWGPGRSIEFRVPEDLRGWQVEMITPSDVALFSGLKDTKLTDLWRIWRQARVVHGMGFELHNHSGFLNLFQWWRESGHAFIPEHHLDMSPPCHIEFGTDLLRKTRAEAAHAIDRRVIEYVDGTLREVIRLDPRSSFSRLEDIYGSLSELESGDLLGTVLTDKSPVWVLRAYAESGSPDEYENWHTVLRWLELMLKPFEQRFSAAADQPVLIEINVEWPDGPIHEVDLTDDAIAEAIEVSIDTRARTAKLSILRGWHSGLNREDNYAERILAEQILVCVAGLRSIDASRAEIRDLIDKTIGSNDVRWRHAFRVERPIEVMRARGLLGGRYRPVPISASALIKCCSALSVEGVKPGQKISGPEDCFTFLSKLKAELLDTLCNAISYYDREAFVVAALDHYQSALAEERSWAMTARALQAIHGEEDDRNASFERRGEINATIRGCSILAEIAASQARSSGGLAVGKMDLDEFQAAALQVFWIADLIPALRGGQLVPEFGISPTGHLLLNQNLHDSVLAPMVRVLHSKERIEHSNAYTKHFIKHEQDRPPSDEHQPFRDAVRTEFGVPAEVFLEFGNFLADLAFEQGKSTFTIRRSELVRWLDARQIKDQPDFAYLVDRLILPSRPTWESLPEGTSERDFDIARFDRPRSLIGRPLVALNTDTDPLLVIAPAIVERAARHNLSGAAVGGLQGEFWVSKQMRSYVGGAGNRAGLEFNERVADLIRSQGLRSEASVKPSACLNQKATDALKRLGDIDVLAFTEDGRHAWVIEAKDIKLCRTMSETAKRLSEYRGVPLANGKPDNLQRHLNRVTYVREYAAGLAQRNKLPVVPTVHGLVVVDVPQPMTFVTASNAADARFVTIDAITEINWNGG